MANNAATIKKLMDLATKKRGQGKHQEAKRLLEQANDAGARKSKYSAEFDQLARAIR